LKWRWQLCTAAAVSSIVVKVATARKIGLLGCWFDDGHDDDEDYGGKMFACVMISLSFLAAATLLEA